MRSPAVGRPFGKVAHTDTGAAAPPRVSICLRQSLALLGARPVVMLSLGVAIVLSLVSVCCGIGIATAPWFLCELAAVQLAEGQHKRIERSFAWVAAATVLSGAVLLTSSVAWLSLLGLGTEALGNGPPEPAHWPPLLSGAGLFAAAAALVAVVFVLPFLYSALMLVEGRTTLGSATLESARLVSRGGVLAHLRLSLSANFVQIAPLLLGLLPSASGPSARPSLWLLLLVVPLLSLSIPLGQGMIASAYMQRHGAVVESRLTQPQGRPPRPLVLLWVCLVVAPLVSFGALGSSLVRPSRPTRGRLPPEVELMGQQTLSRGQLTLEPPGTALTIRASPTAVEVVASDGGGAGRLPLRGEGPLQAARVGRLRDAYGIEITRGQASYLTWVDTAGVRLDDGLRARLADRVPPWALLLMLGSLFVTASLLLPVLAGLAELRRAHALTESPASDPELSQLGALRRRVLGRAAVAAALLGPLALSSLYWGFQALFPGL